MSKPVMALRRAFAFPVPPDQLWSTIERVEEFERWWPWLESFSVEAPPGGRPDGPAPVLAPGTVLHGVVAPPLPYRLRIDVELTRCDRPGAIDAVVRGDLEGTARLRLVPNGPGTQAQMEWRVEMMQRTMRLADRVAHPLLQWGHDRVVESTLAGFSRRLAQG